MTVQYYMFNQGLNNMSIISVQCMPALLTLRCYQLRGYTNTHDTLWLQLHFLVFVYLTLRLLEILLVYKNRLEPFSLKLSDHKESTGLVHYSHNKNCSSLLRSTSESNIRKYIYHCHSISIVSKNPMFKFLSSKL